MTLPFEKSGLPRLFHSLFIFKIHTQKSDAGNGTELILEALEQFGGIFTGGVPCLLGFIFISGGAAVVQAQR